MSNLRVSRVYRTNCITGFQCVAYEAEEGLESYCEAVEVDAEGPGWAQLGPHGRNSRGYLYDGVQRGGG